MHLFQRLIALVPKCIQLPFIFVTHVGLRTSALRFPLRDFRIPLIELRLELGDVLFTGVHGPS